MNQTKLWIGFLACIAMFHTANAQSEKLPSNFFMSKLENGLEILVIEDRTVPLATIEISTRNGSYTEPPEYNGLSHLYEHMFFKANRDYPSQEKFLERVKELGIVFNGTTSNERVNYFITLGNYNLRPGLEFINSAIRYPLFDKEEMKRENVVVDGEFQRNESNPVFFLINDLNYKMWGDHYCRKNPIGDHNIIRTATPEKMKVIQEKFYHPNNSILCVAGDVNHDEVFAMVKDIYSAWPASTIDPFKRWPIPDFYPMVDQNNFVVINENAKSPMIIGGYHGPDTRNDLPATYAADVFSTILNLRTSALQKALVESGLAFNVNVNYQTCKFTGPIQIFMVPNPARIKEAIKVLQDEIKKWDRDDYFTDEQLSTAKSQLEISDAFGKEQTSNFVHTVTYWWASASIGYYTNYNENVHKVTREEIKSYVRKYIQNQPSAWGVLVDPKSKESMQLDESIFVQK
ncbi:MAG: insulinase family protein [Bacteroidetes bacterium]|jgi:zinc protease|nr:insulinase family protein [Bacteroidota bacterium]MBK9524817.1 insulinase family protein [Bacteroidota bacterium]MBK9542983.1 insulinase family protein [Bacteroidota bacterium]MBP6400916.1 insulinase family protein [Bacteroidia bacterium]